MRVPKYRRHTSRSLGFAEHNGHRTYFPGKYNSAESRQAYRDFVARVMGAQHRRIEASGLTVAGLVAAYLMHAKARYGNGPRTEFANCKYALKPFGLKHAGVLAVSFGPLKLKAWQNHLVSNGAARSYVNQCCAKIRRAFKWAASEELIPADVYHGLTTVEPVKKGRATRRRVPVTWDLVKATLPRLSQQVADMVQVQWLTGCRSGSLVRATPEQFTTTGDVWEWRPRHKTEHLGRELVISVGPKAQAILRKYLSKAPGQFLFSPKAVRRDVRYNARYSTQTYYRAVKRGIERAKVPDWFPHLLRHSRIDQTRQEHGLEAAQAIAGHDSLEATKLYSAARLKLAKKVAKRTG